MLTFPEKVVFILAVLVTLYLSWRAVERIVRTLQRGQGEVDWGIARKRLGAVLAKVITLSPTFRTRPGPSIFHAFIAWGFMYYLLVNVGDVLEGFFPGLTFLGSGTVGGLYRLIADILSVAVLIGMVVLLARRFIHNSASLRAREDVLFWPGARRSIRRDSAIVGLFILVHVGSRFLGEAFEISRGAADPWQPFASAAAVPFRSLNAAAQLIGVHVFFWLALGTILAFIPYFLYSKHIHLFMAPLNFLLKPERRSIGALDRLDFDDETIEQFGASHLEDLGWEQVMDAYACIMCYRCQDACPAYATGKVLSPAALEINKRYFLNYEGGKLAQGEPSQMKLLDFAIPDEAVWACTACGACIDICPVGNEPMRDILDIRRAQVLMENDFPEPLQTAFRGMERTANPWNIAPENRTKWAEGYSVPTVDDEPEPDILWWVGCAPATDPGAQKTAQTFARILNHAGVKYAILGQHEQCTGDSARRAGNEFLFNELALSNVEILNQVAPKRIVTTCPHCLHTLKNEYPAFGGNYDVVHHTQLIDELISAGLLQLPNPLTETVTFHDPCYLGRQNNILDAPRAAIQATESRQIEMPRHGKKSFCCGAGGAQMWKEEEPGTQRVSAARMEEAIETGADTLVVACPFCKIMLNDARNAANSSMQVVDVVELVAKTLDR